MLLGRQKTCKVYDGGSSDRDDNRDDSLKPPRRRSRGSNSGQWVEVPLIVQTELIV